MCLLAEQPVLSPGTVCGGYKIPPLTNPGKTGRNGEPTFFTTALLRRREIWGLCIPLRFLGFFLPHPGQGLTDHFGKSPLLVSQMAVLILLLGLGLHKISQIFGN
jgi:hypothetical protein